MAKLEISKVATEDLIEIEYYISIKLCNEQAAFKIIDGILDLCENLKCNPKRYPLVRFEALRVLGTRIAFYKNYNIFYKYDELFDKVTIMRILYNKNDWRGLL